MSIASQASVSRSFGPTRLKSPIRRSRRCPTSSSFACSTMSPGRVRRELRHGDGAALGVELERHVADRLLVVDDLARLERELGVEGRASRADGCWRGGRRRRRLAGRGRRRRRRRALAPASGRDRSWAATSLASTASAGFKVSASEPEPLSSASASLKSRAANGSATLDGAVEAELAGQQRRQRRRRLAGEADQGRRRKQSGCRPTREPCPRSRALGPSSLSVPLKPSLPPPASSATSMRRGRSLPLAPTARSILSGAPLTVALPASA